MKITFFSFLVSLVVCSFLLISSAHLQAKQAKAKNAETKATMSVFMLLNYVAVDYGSSVVRGEVVNDFEYNEQLDFVDEVARITKTISAIEADPFVQENIKKLRSDIQTLQAEQAIIDSIRKLNNYIVQKTGLNFSPQQFPNLQNGATLYQENCAACHGTQGYGDGVTAPTLEPKPTDFYSERFFKISPTQSYQIVKLGLPETAMQPFNNLSDQQIWDVVFYTAAMKYKQNNPYNPASEQDKQFLLELARLSDQEILQNPQQAPFLSAGISPAEAAEQLAFWRLKSFQQEEQKFSASSYIDQAASLLRQSQQAFQNGQTDAAINLSLESYLLGVEPVEKYLRANDANIVQRMEQGFIQYRSAIRVPGNQTQAQQTYQALIAELQTANNILTQKKVTATVVFTGALVVIFREGLEALLIIMALMTILRQIKQRSALVFMHSGWIAAILAGVLMSLFLGYITQIVKPTSREIFEGAVGFFAVGVLLWAGVWLHNHSSAQKWKQFLLKHLETVLTKKRLLLIAGFSFIAVFREVLESVLFLHLLHLEASADDAWAVYAGTFVGFFVLLFTGLFFIWGTKKLPVPTLFRVSTVIILIVATAITGKSVHSFQEVGYITIHSLPINLSFDMLGLYPSWEVVIAQVLVAVAFCVLLRLGSRTDLSGVPNR